MLVGISVRFVGVDVGVDELNVGVVVLLVGNIDGSRVACVGLSVEITPEQSLYGKYIKIMGIFSILKSIKTQYNY